MNDEQPRTALPDVIANPEPEPVAIAPMPPVASAAPAAPTAPVVPVEPAPEAQKTTRMDDLIQPTPAPAAQVMAPHEDVAQVNPEMVVQDCGLPLHFCFRGSKMQIVRYVTQYEITHKMRLGLQLTQVERELYKVYRHKIGALSAPIDYFVAALRLWKSDHPIARPAPTDLNAFKVT